MNVTINPPGKWYYEGTNGFESHLYKHKDDSCRCVSLKEKDGEYWVQASYGMDEIHRDEQYQDLETAENKALAFMIGFEEIKKDVKDIIRLRYERDELRGTLREINELSEDYNLSNLE